MAFSRKEHIKDELTILKQKYSIAQIRLKEVEHELSCARNSMTKTMIIPKKVATLSEVVPRNLATNVTTPNVDQVSTNEPVGQELVGGTFDDLLGGLEDMPSIWLEDDE